MASSPMRKLRKTGAFETLTATSLASRACAGHGSAEASRSRLPRGRLQGNGRTAAMPYLEDLKAIFSPFIDECQQATGGLFLSQQDKKQLFGQFGLWQRSRLR
jgi:hypothetical protein